MYHKLSAPVSCQIEVTTKCNHNCIHCYNHWRHGEDVYDVNMSRQTLRNTITTIADANVFHVTFTGGEPFLRKDILFEGIKYLVNRGVVCSVNSNLTVFSHQDATQLKSLGVGGILTSIAASKSSLHDRIMQQDGAFEATMNGIKIAQKVGLIVAASMVVTKLNINEVYDTGKFLQSVGVNQFYATKASPPVNSSGFKEYLISHEELISLLDNLVKLHKDLDMKIGALECYPLCGYLDQEKYSFMSGRRCSAGVTTCSIGADGNIRVCSHDNKSYGNVNDKGLLQAWCDMNSWRDGSILPKVCTSCDYLARCSGGCRVDAEYINGCISELDPYANPENISAITLPKPIEQSLDFRLDKIKLKVSKGLKFRDEEFCVLCSGVKKASSPITLSKDSYELLRHFEDKEFLFDDLICYTGLSDKGTSLLCNAFISDGIFQTC